MRDSQQGALAEFPATRSLRAFTGMALAQFVGAASRTNWTREHFAQTM